MDTETSLVVLAAALALLGTGLLGDRARRRAPLGRAALPPWHALIFVGITGTIFMAVHLLRTAI